ncbi:MAG: CMP/dCMP kinase [Eubacteriales bacterium SKADARSKE-1]|nr:CMP/dCMP kinase [Eubacteriales bacterium SKADARSKE-1]
MISIAIDGPAGVGKSTVSKAIAKKLGFIYVDTGAFYRAIALFAVKNNIDEDNIRLYLQQISIEPKFENNLQSLYLNGEDITNQLRFEKISIMASRISAVPEVRDFLLNLQRNIALTNNVVMDGRDIGTVVLPHAAVKIFLTATTEKRAKRRYNEMIDKGEPADYNEILHNIIKRDSSDSIRKVAPLKPADDSVIIDTSEYNLKESIECVLSIINKKLKTSAKFNL